MTDLVLSGLYMEIVRAGDKRRIIKTMGLLDKMMFINGISNKCIQRFMFLCDRICRKRIDLLGLCILLFFSNNVFATEGIRGQAELNYGRYKNDNNEKDMYYGGGAVYYFQPAQRTSGPWYEADYLERISSLGAVYWKYDISNFSDFTGYDSYAYALGLHYAEKKQPIVVDVYYAHGKSDWYYVPSALNGKQEYDTYTVSLGFYVLKTAVLGMKLGKFDSSLDYEQRPTYSANYDMYSVFGKWLYLLNDNKAINLKFDIQLNRGDSFYVENDSSNVYQLEGDYYFTNKTSLGLNIMAATGDAPSNEGNTYGINVRTFLTKSFSVDVTYLNFRAKNTEGVNNDGYSLNLSYWY